MLRTQTSRTVGEKRVLDAESARAGRSIAALIRDALEVAYGTGRSTADDLADMRRAFGSWKEHDLDGAEWLEQLRSGSPLPGA